MEDEVEFDKLVGSNVQKYRRAKGMSQSELAAEMSEGGEHVHQQTIQKIEKGTRPLKYSEAVRICRALWIGIAQLSDGAGRAAANARYLERFAVLNQMSAELGDFARRLVPVLVDLAELVALESGDSEATGHVRNSAETWLRENWGKNLNNQILEELRVHPDLAELPEELNASTYGEVLKRFSAVTWERERPADVGADDDASEA
ncbi:helix-turn-helix domain-containing protein [Mycolicibacterium sp. XJ1819]